MRPSTHTRLSRVVVAALLVVAAAPAGARAAGAPGSGELLRGVLFDSEVVPGSPLRGAEERLVPRSGLLERLLAVPPDGSLDVEEWPVAPGERRAVRLFRREVYGPGAEVLRVDGPGTTSLPRSTWVFFEGRTAGGGAAVRLMVAVDPAEGVVLGLSQTGSGLHEIRKARSGADPGLLRLALAEDFLHEEAPSATWTCGEEMLSPRPPLPAASPGSGALLRSATAPLPRPEAAALGATIAVDTDNELLSLMFSDNTTTATNYIASLFAAMNVIYERDTGVRLLQGTTILRPSSSPDPWAQSGSPANGAELSEFSQYWSANYGAVSRASAILLSGKSSSSSSASGISWLDSLCSTTYGYSVSQVFRVGYLAGDTLIVGHEIGHSFSSPHTHCYADPRPDTCWNQEPCYGGPKSCPPSATYNGVTTTGTLMSYCHLLSGCWSGALVFHPATLSRYLDGAIALASARGGCIVPLVSPPTLVSVAPTSGPASGGTPITLAGTGFVAPATVTVGGAAAAGVSVGSATSITATTPAGAPGARDVVVTTPGGSASLVGAFTYVAAPAVAFVAPASGPTAGGTAVAVTGAGFVAGAAVSFGTSAAPSVTFVSSTRLNVAAPAGSSGIVDVTVTNPDGQAGTLPSAYRYSDAPPPVTGLYSVTPCRVFDTRGAAGPRGGPAIPGNGSRVFPVANVCAIPPWASAVSVNVTVTSTVDVGYLKVYPGDGAAPNATVINFRPGQTRANNAILRLAGDGSGTLAVSYGGAGSVHVLLDVNGWFR